MGSIDTILNRGLRGKGLEPDEALRLLREVKPDSELGSTLLRTADRLSRRHFGGAGEVHAQIGLNWGYCGQRCAFCPLCAEDLKEQTPVELTVERVVSMAREYEAQGINAISLMSTASYRFDRFCQVGRRVSKALTSSIPLVANCGDIDDAKARQLVRSGFSGFYHAIRLREGVDTNIPKQRRVASIEAALRAGLFFGSCIEPIGPEHSAEEIVALMALLRDLGVGAVAVMRRVSYPGDALAERGEIGLAELARLTAVGRLFFGHTVVAFGAHEPNIPCLRAGANVVYAEAGANPREEAFAPQTPRGRSVQQAVDMLNAAGLRLHRGNVTPRYLRLALRGSPALRKLLLRHGRQVWIRMLGRASSCWRWSDRGETASQIDTLRSEP